jgi:VCBS repeat-containing protein
MRIASVAVDYLDPGGVLGEGVQLVAAPEDGGSSDPATWTSVVATSFPGQDAVGYSNWTVAGYNLGGLRVFPVQYEAATGTLLYHGDIAVTVTAVPGESGATVRNLTADRERVAGLIDNPEALDAYAAGLDGSAADGSGTLLGDSGPQPAGDPPASYQYVIVTSAALESSFQPLVAQKQSRGLTAAIVTTEYIYANYTGLESTALRDNADKIRDFIRDSYLNRGTRWVLLGGDVEVVPKRGVYVENGSYVETSMPSDLYFACLDGPWNGDGDSRWGEATDGIGGGEIDLMAEVYVGRAPASNATEANNFVAKTIQYETQVHPNAHKAVFLGEKMDVNTYSSNSAIDIRDTVLPATWLPELVERYDTATYSFSRTDVLGDLNASPHIVESSGHSNASTDSRITTTDVGVLTNTFPYFMYSQGCNAGSFDTADVSIGEKHVVAEHGAFGVVMNARYGWYSGGWPSGSHYYAKEFWDAVYNEGKLHLGEANQDSKDDNLWRVIEFGDYRWINFETNLFGDPETSFHFESEGGNHAPVAVGDSYSTSEDTVLNVAAGSGVLANDTDVDGDTLTAVLVAGPSHGSLTLSSDGSFVYTPAANYHGGDTFTYKANDGTADSSTATVSITVSAVNDAPVAAADSYSTNEDAVLTVAAGSGVLANDTDVDLDPLTAVLVAGPSHGSLTLNANGSFVYTPATNYHGGDTFTYKANDGTVDSNTATVSITVNSVNDAPVAVADSYSTSEDTALNVAAGSGVLANDTDADGDPLTAVLVAGPSNGSLTLNANGSFSYTPTANYHGGDTFTYKANDGTVDSNVATVSLTVTSVNDAPVAVADSYLTPSDTVLSVTAPGVLTNDTDADGNPLTAVLVAGPSHGTLTLNTNGSFVYTPAARYNGPDSFTYRANDGTADSNVATVSITVRAPSISGYVWNDPNANGWDPGETMLSGWTVFLDSNGNGVPDSGERTAVSASDGYYAFGNLTAGTYTVREVVQSGWRQAYPGAGRPYTVTLSAGQSVLYQSFGNQQVATTGSISGYVWNDPNANGWDAGETMLSGWTVFLDGNGNGGVDSGEPTAVSASNGYYAFADVTPGTYTVREVVQSGWRQTYPSAGRPYTVTLSAGQSMLYLSFGNQQVAATVATGSISGYVWNDPNANGWDAGETVLSGWTVFLDGNGNGIPDSGEPTAVSASNGYYAFGSLTAGTYTVREVVQSGWRQTYPSAGRPYTVTLSAGQSVLYLSFGNQQVASTGSISGYVWNDPNANGWDPGETMLSGWTVFLDSNGNGILDSGEQSTASASNGYYAFADLTAGTYTVREVVQSGWRQTYPSAGRPYTVALSAGQSMLYHSFGNQQVIGTGSISGYVWNDPNANGWDPGETMLSGWTVFLDSNGNGGVDSGEPTAVSASNGYYAFGSLTAGTYTVREVAQSGWLQTYPSAGRPYTVTLSAGQSVIYQSFGNQQVATKAGISGHVAALSLPSETHSTRPKLADAVFAALVGGEDWLYPIPLA